VDRSTAAILILVAALAMPGAALAEGAGEQPAGSRPAAPTALVPLSNARIPIAGLLSGGQPTPEQIDLAARAGFHTVINLRPDEEGGFEWERGAVERLGMRYVQIPVAGASGLTRAVVERFDAELRRGLADGPVLLHCASGNRNGALLALRAAWLEGKAPEEALRFGLDSGLTRLEGATREKLGLAAATP